MILSADPS